MSLRIYDRYIRFRSSIQIIIFTKSKKTILNTEILQLQIYKTDTEGCLKYSCVYFRLHEFLILNNANIEYDFNMKTKECRKSTPRPWRPFAIPSNATFEDEFYIGGPGEEVFAQDWSDRVPYSKRERERNVLFNDALNTFYLRLYGIRHMVKDHSDSEKGNSLPPHRLLLSINSKGSFICTIPQTG